MAGLRLMILLLWAGGQLAASDPEPDCSYSVTPIKFGLQFTITTNINGNYSINIHEEGRPETGMKYNIDRSDKTSSRDIKHLKPCTEYEHNVTFVDPDGRETSCNSRTEKTTTTEMTKDDITDVSDSASCKARYVCYRSEWDISSSLSTSSNVPAQQCNNDSEMFCIEPAFEDICSDLTTTFTSGNCENSHFSLTRSISVDFLTTREIVLKAEPKFPAEIRTMLPPNCKDLTTEYTCWEIGKAKKLSELEPFTDYTCIGHIKHNSVILTPTTTGSVRVDCDLEITSKSKSATDTSIDLSWTTTSNNCLDALPTLEKLSYSCDCQSIGNRQSGNVVVNRNPTEGTCKIAGLQPYTDYTCNVQPTYNNKKVSLPARVEQRTEIGKPDDISDIYERSHWNNVPSVRCYYYDKRFNGPEKKFIARLYAHYESLELLKQEANDCDFEFKDLNYSTSYRVEVTAFNGKYESKSATKTLTYRYNTLKVWHVIIIVVIIGLSVVAYMTCCVKCRKSRNDENEDEMSTAIYAYEQPPE